MYIIYVGIELLINSFDCTILGRICVINNNVVNDL